MNPSLVKDIHSLEPGSIVELFDLDLTSIDPAAGIARFHAGTNKLEQPVVWQGHTYLPRPVQASGFGISTTGSAPRPKMQVSNIPLQGTVGVMTLMNRDYHDLVGAVITRRRTLVKYLDAVNFQDGINPSADPTAEFPLDVYYVERRLVENRIYSEYELSSIHDLEGILLPTRQVIRDTCMYTYRTWNPDSLGFDYVDPRGILVDCPYTGVSCYDGMGVEVADPSLDVCGRRLSDCRKRFSQGATRTLANVAKTTGGKGPVTVNVLPAGGVLPFGGFPGVGRYR